MARVYLIAGLGYGDEGKGTITDFLTRSSGAHLVVRYNGGAQAGHNVVLPDGRHHTFSQFGSGSFVPGVGTHLSRHMLVNPLFMFPEANHLIDLGETDIWDRVTVDREALVTNPFQVAVNRLKEIYRGDGRHGSCGMGIGETMQDSLEHPEDSLRAGNLTDPDKTEKLLRLSQERKLAEMTAHGLRPMGYLEGTSRANVEWAILQDTNWCHELAHGLYRDWANKVTLVEPDWLTSQVNGEGVVIFEGAQGALLDEDFGFHPYTTWSHCTFKNATDLLKDHNDYKTRVGVLRTYMTRHGKGPFVTEDKDWKLTEGHNKVTEWQQGFRVGYFDVPAMHYALTMLYDSCKQPLDMFAMTHMDVVPPKFCTKYDYYLKYWGQEVNLDRQATLATMLGKVKPEYKSIDRMEDFIDYIETEFGTKIGIFSYGPTHEDKSLHDANYY